MSRITICFCLLFFGVCQAQVIDLTFEGSNGGQAVLVENCESDTSYIVIAGNQNMAAFSGNIALSGSAEADSDYSIDLPDAIVIDSVTPSIRIPIQVLNDDIIEGQETVVIQLTDLSNDSVIAEISIDILDAVSIEIAGPDTLQVCQDALVSLSAMSSISTISWSYGDTESAGSAIEIRPDDDLTVIASIGAGSCEASDTVEIELIAGATFDLGDTAFVCLPSTINLSVSTIGQPGELTWAPLDSTIELATGGNSATITTDQTRTYTIQLTTADCVVADTIVVRVDSLPTEMPITNVPAKDSYCPGETVSLFSRYLDPMDFPDVEYMWTFTAGTALSDQDLQNFAFITQDTSVFTRVTTNNACMITDTILINVVRPPVELNITDTTVCPNQDVQIILLTADELDSFEWMPTDGLRCGGISTGDEIECPDPIAKTAQSMSWTVTGMKDDCPASASVNVNIAPVQQLVVIPDTAVCKGSDVQLSILDAMGFGDFQWLGTNLSCTNCGVPTASDITAAEGKNTFSVTGESAEGCLAQGSVVVQVFPDSDAAINVSPEIDQALGGLGSGTIVTLTTIAGGSPYTWTQNGESIDGTGESVTAVIRGGNNSFRVDFSSANGCPVSANVEITGVQPTWGMPNAFTPNSNEDPPINERFRVVQITGMVEVVELKVFNRWGQIVYSDNNENGWDGNHNGKAAPAEVYSYIASVRYPDGEVEVRRGEVALIR